MLIKAEQKFLRMSPEKIRLIANSVRKIKSPQEVLARLEFVNKRAAQPLAKILKQAMANATNNLGLLPESLKVKEMVVNEGPVYKRGRAVSRGSFHRVEKKTSHIRIILETEEKKSVDHSPRSTVEKKVVSK